MAIYGDILGLRWDDLRLATTRPWFSMYLKASCEVAPVHPPLPPQRRTLGVQDVSSCERGPWQTWPLAFLGHGWCFWWRMLGFVWQFLDVFFVISAHEHMVVFVTWKLGLHSWTLRYDSQILGFYPSWWLPHTLQNADRFQWDMWDWFAGFWPKQIDRGKWRVGRHKHQPQKRSTTTTKRKGKC